MNSIFILVGLYFFINLILLQNYQRLAKNKFVRQAGQ